MSYMGLHWGCRRVACNGLQGLRLPGGDATPTQPPTQLCNEGKNFSALEIGDGW